MLSCIRSHYIWKAPVILSPSNCKALPDFRNYFVSLFPLALNSKPDKKEHLFVWRYSYPFRLSSTLSSPYPTATVPATHFMPTQSWICTSCSSLLLAQGSPCKQPLLNQAQTHHQHSPSLTHHKGTVPTKQPKLLTRACLWLLCSSILYCRWKLSSNLKDVSP